MTCQRDSIENITTVALLALGRCHRELEISNGKVYIGVKWAPHLVPFDAAFCSLHTRAKQDV